MSLGNCVNSEASAKRGDQTASAAKAEMDTSGTKASTRTSKLQKHSSQFLAKRSVGISLDNCGNSEAEAKLG